MYGDGAEEEIRGWVRSIGNSRSTCMYTWPFPRCGVLFTDLASCVDDRRYREGVARVQEG